MSNAQLKKMSEQIDMLTNRATQFIFFDTKNYTITIKNKAGEILRRYTPEKAPTVLSMHRNRKDFNRLIMGPRGSSKSSGCCAEPLFSTYLSSPCSDGVKRSRWLIGRDTYPQLKTTTIKTFIQWFGFDELEFRIVFDSPICAYLNFFDGEAFCSIEFLFISFDDEKSVRKALSLELSGAYFNEGASIPTSVLEQIRGSIGRFPSQMDRIKDGYYWHGMIIDTNSFPDYHPFHTKFVGDKFPNHAFYLQPGGMIEVERGKFEVNILAENLPNLPKNYYENMAEGASLSFIRTQICNQFGYHEENKPVHPEYSKDVHSIDFIDYDPMHPIMLGLDYGGTNAVLVCQFIRGQLRCIKELINSVDGLRKFLKDDVSNYLMAACGDLRVSVSVGDPADNFSHESALASSQIATEALGITTIRALTNVIKRRIDAVDSLILTKFGGGKSALIVSRKGCPVLHAGLAGKYQLKLVKNSDSGLMIEKPLKNEFSHTCDCLQYIALYVERLHKNPGLTEHEKQQIVNEQSW